MIFILNQVNEIVRFEQDVIAFVLHLPTTFQHPFSLPAFFLIFKASI